MTSSSDNISSNQSHELDAAEDVSEPVIPHENNNSTTETISEQSIEKDIQEYEEFCKKHKSKKTLNSTDKENYKSSIVSVLLHI